MNQNLDFITTKPVNNPDFFEGVNKYEKGSIEYHLYRGLDLFQANEDLADIKILTDSKEDIVRINGDKFIMGVSGIEKIWNLVSQPTKSENIIRAREYVIDTISSLDKQTLKDLYDFKNDILALNGFLEKFEKFYQLKSWIEDYSEEDFKEIEGNSIFHKLEEAFVVGISDKKLKSLETIIPEYLKLIENIGGDFFVQTARKLKFYYEKAEKFTFADLKKLVDEDDRKGFYNLQKDIEKFCEIFSIFDGVLIVSRWNIAKELEHAQSIKNENILEQADDIADIRHLLNMDRESFDDNILNSLVKTNATEVYTGGNGSGKSTWLKNRLVLQLLFQTYGKVAANNAKLKIREQIVFINRTGKSYGDDLSAFGTDVKKIKLFLDNIQKNALVFLDEFGSTIPEQEAFYLIRAVVEYVNKCNVKLLLSTHNERYIKFIDNKKVDNVKLFHFKTKQKNGKFKFTYKLTSGKDDAYSLNIFRQFGISLSILKNFISKKLKGNSINSQNSNQLYPVVTYSKEEKEKLQKENIGFAGLSRYNEMLKLEYEGGFYDILRKYEEYGEENAPSVYYGDEDLFFGDPPGSMGEKHSGLDFEFLYFPIREGYSDDRKKIIDYLSILENRKHKEAAYTDYSGTLHSLTTWGLTSDIKKLQERQLFFEELGKIPYKKFEKVVLDYSHYSWVYSLFINNFNSIEFDLDYLKKFNKVYRDYFLKKIDSSFAYYGGDNVIGWAFTLIELEKKLGNIDDNFYKIHEEGLAKLNKVFQLLKRLSLARKRSSKFENKFKNSRKLADEIIERIKDTIEGLSDDDKDIVKIIKNIFKDLDDKTKDIDIFSLDDEKIGEIAQFISDEKLFLNYYDKNAGTYIVKGVLGMNLVIKAMKGEGMLFEPILEDLRSIDSIYSHSLANYLEDFCKIPDVKKFRQLVKAKRELSDNVFYKIKDREGFTYFREHKLAVFYEFLGLASAANMMKKLGWTKVNYNSTGEIEIKGLYHAGKNLDYKQVKNDSYLNKNQSFNLIEGSTMGGKSFNIESIHLIMRAVHSIGLAPADYVSTPVFDGVIFIDRILEDEKNKLSAGQNDAKTWSIILEKVKNKISEQAKTGRYWFSIDEMLSSIPARYQEGFVASILEELTALGQRGQLAIHNPELISKLEKDNPQAYSITHPEVVVEDGDIEYTYKIVEGRSIDKNGNFSAYSIETARKLGLNEEILKLAEKYRKEDLK